MNFFRNYLFLQTINHILIKPKRLIQSINRGSIYSFSIHITPQKTSATSEIKIYKQMIIEGYKQVIIERGKENHWNNVG